MRRPPRGYRQLTRRIFELATQAVSRRRFIKEIARLLSGFAACDTIEIWLRFNNHQEGWAYAVGEDVFCPLGQGQRRAAGALEDERCAADLTDPGPQGSSTRLELAFGDEVAGELVLHANQPDFFSDPKLSLYQDVASNLSVAIAYHHAQFSQRERVKELACLYQIARLAGQPDMSLPQLLQRVVEILPQAWQYPDVCVARVQFTEFESTSARFDEARQVQEALIVIDGEQRGLVAVGYLEAKPPQDEGPFLQEERNLLETVAGELGRIADRKRVEQERRALREQLQHADRLATIGQLAAGVAHELNEPLGSILGFAQLTKKVGDLPDQVTRDLARIEAAALHSREIVKKLNLFARSETEQPRLTDLNGIIRDGLVFLESRLVKEGIELRLSLDSHLQEVLADPGQMTQVLMNLVVNAAQAMPSGGVLSISTRACVEEIVWRISDTGCGMSPEVATRIFEPFYTTKDVGEGTGLGLAVVHGIVSAHGGTIQVTSAPDAGAQFEIHLPTERSDGSS